MLRHDLFNLGIQQTIPRLRLPRFDSPPAEQQFNLFNRLTGGFGIGEKGLNGGTKTQDTKDDEEFPGNMFKAWWDEETNGKVEQPIGNGSEGHTGGTGFEGPNFGGINPSDGSEGDGIDEDEEVTKGDDGVGGRTGDVDFDTEVSLETVGEVGAVRAEDATDDEHANAHADGAVDQKRSTTGDVDEEKGGGSTEDEEGVLDTGRDEIDVFSQTSHFKYINHIISHDLSISVYENIQSHRHTFAPESCCQAWTEVPAKVRFHMPFVKNRRQPC